MRKKSKELLCGIHYLQKCAYFKSLDFREDFAFILELEMFL